MFFIYSLIKLLPNFSSPPSISFSPFLCSMKSHFCSKCDLQSNGRFRIRSIDSVLNFCLFLGCSGYAGWVSDFAYDCIHVHTNKQNCLLSLTNLFFSTVFLTVKLSLSLFHPLRWLSLFWSCFFCRFCLVWLQNRYQRTFSSWFAPLTAVFSPFYNLVPRFV